MNAFYLETPEVVNLEVFSEEDINNLLQTDASIIGCLLNCSNHGQCIFTIDGQFACNCFQNYTGFSCQDDKRKCSTKPCINNSTCYDVIKSENFDFYCECAGNYHGRHCEFEVDVCQNETCSNHGVCKKKLKQPECDCFPFYTGNKCETEMSEKKLVEMGISISSILAIIILVSFYSLFLINDLVNCFGRFGTKKLKKRKEKTQRFVYKNSENILNQE